MRSWVSVSALRPVVLAGNPLVDLYALALTLAARLPVFAGHLQGQLQQHGLHGLQHDLGHAVRSRYLIIGKLANQGRRLQSHTLLSSRGSASDNRFLRRSNSGWDSGGRTCQQVAHSDM